MKIKLQMKEDELSSLAQLALLGEYVVNSVRDEEKKIKKYSDIVYSLYNKVYEISTGVSHAEENELADIHDRLFDGVSCYLGLFEHDIRNSQSFDE